MIREAIKKEISIKELSSYLRMKGLKATPARLSILALLQKEKRPLTIQEVLGEMKNEKIDQATVYRGIKTLKEVGLVRQIDFQHGHAHFELVDEEDHHHLTCIKCKRVEDFTGCDMDNIKQSILANSPNFVSIEDHAVELFGVCKGCNK